MLVGHRGQHRHPGRQQVEQLGPQGSQLFFSLYFMMTGIHALHMVIGLGIMSYIWWKAYKGTYDAEYFAPVEVSGLYWHFVDIVWIFLFPLLYLVDRTHKFV